MHLQTHYMSCLKCDMKFESKSGNKARLREVLAKHMADVHDVSATCPTCYQVFNSSNNKRANQNSMEQHQQVHRPRVHSCPLGCVRGVQRFRSQANAVQHVEAGACPNCPGRDAARNGVYNFVARNQETRHMLSSQPQLEYTGSGARYDIPDRPYKCNQCEKNFKDLGGMMQHQESAHRMVNRRLALR